MLNNFYNKILLGLIIIAISGCGLFGKEPLDIKGKRISVLKETVNLTPDYEPGEVKIKLPAPYTNTKWSQNGGNSQHLMGHLESGSSLDERWDASLGEGNSKRNFLIATPIVAYNVVFAIDADGIVTATRLKDGKRIWKKRLKPTIKEDGYVSIKGAGVAEYNKKIYATTGFGAVFALDMKTGKQLWRYDTQTPIRIAPTVNANRVFIQTMENVLISLDATDGKLLWKDKTDFEATTLMGGASPAYSVDMDVVIAAYSNGELQAYKASTGTPLWVDLLVSKKRTNSLANITAIKANPVIDDDKVFAIGNNSILAAIDLRTGNRIWEKEIGSKNQPWIAGEYLFILTNDFDLLALDKNNGKIIWNTNIPYGNDINNKSGVFATGPTLSSNKLLVTTSNGYIFSISPYTGEILSYISISDGVDLPTIIANQTAIFTTNDADILAYK